MAQSLDRQRLRRLWEDALIEDGAESDITSLIAAPEKQIARSRIVARAAGVFAGAAVLNVLREAYPTQLTLEVHVVDGAALQPGTVIASLTGPLRLLLGIERTLLNFLQRLCGVATMTRHYVDAVAGTRARIYDTRKTLPGWRELDKYAVRCGGGRNHRMGLHDAILVKDNHLARIEPARLRDAAKDMIDAAMALVPPPRFVEFEVDTLAQLEEVLAVPGVDIVLLDNFTPEQMRAAVARRDALGLLGKVELEASGGVTLGSTRQLADAGVERIAVGAITHSAAAVDIAMDVESE